MADFNSHIITNAGRNLLARALAGEGKVLFTKAAFGDQKHSGNLREVTELKNKKLDLNVMNIRNDNGTAILTVQISNENVEQSFQTEEFGVYAKIEGDITEILYSYTTAVSADTFPNNRLGKTYESIQDIYMAISSDIEAEIYVRDGVIYLTRDIANQVYTETGLVAVGTLKGRNNLEADKQYLADNGHWYKNIGGNRTWEATSGTPDEQLIPITWKYLYESLNNKENQLIQNLNGILGQNNGEFPVEQAVAGNVYYFPRNQKYYYCLKSQTSRVSVPNADFEELSIYQNRKKLENLSTFKIQELYSTPAGVKFTIFQYGSLILIAAYTYGAEKLNYGTSYKCNLPYDCYNTATAITGNNASSGQFSLVNNVLIVNSTDNQVPLKNTFMGQLTTFLK